MTDQREVAEAPAAKAGGGLVVSSEDHGGYSITPIMWNRAEPEPILSGTPIPPAEPPRARQLPALSTAAGVDTAVEMWLNAFGSPNTQDGYRRDINRWIDWCRQYGIRIHEAMRADVDAYRAEMEDAFPRPKPATIARRLAAVSSFHGYWAEHDALPRNPAAHVRRPKAPGEPASVALTQQQATDLIGRADIDGFRSALVVRILLATGMRVSELCNAAVADLGYSSGHRTLTIVRKGGKRATLPLTPVIGHLIDVYLAGRQDGPLLRTSGGKRLDRSYVRKLLRRLAREAGLPDEVCEAMHPHVLRHTVATLLDEAGEPIQEIQRLLGHADPRTTEIYTEHRKGLDASPVYVMGRLLAA